MTTVHGTLRLRPIRIGFVVDPTDMPSVRQAMQISTCLWGGFYNPIIPVAQEIPEPWKDRPFSDPPGTVLAKGYIDFFEPDVLVETKPGLSINLDFKNPERTFDGPRIFPVEDFLKSDKDRQRELPVGLEVFWVYKALYEREFKFVPRHDHGVAEFIDVTPEDQPFVDATCGSFPDTECFRHLPQAYKDAFAPHALKATPRDWLAARDKRYRFPLHFTRDQVERAPDAGLSDPVLFVVDPSSPLDLLDLWNLRLFRRNVTPVNERWFSELIPFIRDFVTRNHRPLPGNPYGVMIHTTLEFGRSIGEARARSLLEKAELHDLPQGSWSFKLWYERIWRRLREDHIFSPRRAFVTSKSHDLEVEVSQSGRSRAVRYATLAPDFAPQYGNSRAAWVNVVRFRSRLSEGNLALSFPPDFDPARTISMRAGGLVIPSREGLVLPQNYKGHGEYLQVLTGREMAIEWLAQHGVKAEVSSSGRTAEQVIASVGGLWGAQLLAHRDTLHLMNNMAKSVRKYSDGVVEEYADRTAAATAWSSLIARRKEDAWGAVELEHFVESNVLRLGLAIACKHCAFNNSYPVGGLKETLSCDRCRRDYPFPQGTLSFGSAPWKYRVIGPFSLPDYADGAYATTLALRVFSQSLNSDATITYAPGLTLTEEGKEHLEIDFVLWYSRSDWLAEDDETVMVFGEAKSFATQCFQDRDVERMRRLAERFPGSFLVFATLKDELEPAEKARIAPLAEWGREPLDDGRPRAPVIVLSGIELFSSWRITMAWKNAQGKRKTLAESGHINLSNLWTLADVTQQISLDMPSRSVQLRRRSEARNAS